MTREPAPFEKITRDLIVAQLKASENAPVQAALIAKKAIVGSIQGTGAKGERAGEIVRQICAGAMGGVLLIEKSLPKTAVAMLQNMAEAAQEVDMDPQQMMTWGMEGIARAAPLMTPALLGMIQEDIESCFMGAGQIFSELCRKAP